MRWVAFTNGGMNSAGSRICGFYPMQLSSFAQRNEVTFNPQQIDINNIDVLYIQKCFQPQVAEIAKLCRAANKKIIFSLDDPPEIVTQNDNSSILSVYLSVADIVMVDTPERLQFFQQRYNLSDQLAVVSCCIDIADERHLAQTWTMQNRADTPLSAVWFGNDINFHCISGAFVELAQRGNCQLYVCGGGGLQRLIADHNLPFHFIPWSLDFWEKHRDLFDVSLLSHFGSDADLAKSENKMLASIAQGVLPIVSRTPSYTKAAKLFGLDNYVFGTNDALVGIIEKLAARPALPSLPPIADKMLEHYSRERIGRLIESLAA